MTAHTIACRTSKGARSRQVQNSQQLEVIDAVMGPSTERLPVLGGCPSQ